MTRQQNAVTGIQDTKSRRTWQVRAEQIRSVYSHAPTTMFFSLVTGVALVSVMWEQVNHTVLVGWLLALCAYQALRMYGYRVYMSKAPVDVEHVRWDRRYILGTIAAGLIWGSAGVLMYVPGSLAHQAMLTLVLVGCATVAMTWLSYFALAFYTLIPLMLGPVIVRMLLDPGPAHIYLAIPGIIVLLVVLFFGRKVNCIIAESLHKHFENLDLIEELRAQKAIAERAQQAAETANRSKTQFFAAASHDLRQPLHAMGLFAGALHQNIKDPQVLHVVDSINASVAALEGLFNELLDISKIDSGVIKPEPVHFAASGMLAKLQREFEVEAREKGLKFKTVPSSRYAYSDDVLVERILRNLISNALRYTTRGGVVVGCRWRPDRVRFEVWDSGPGIPVDEQEKIFEEFYQLHNPGRTSKKGLGLGLSIVQRLCNLLDCRVTLKSRTGRGTMFGFDVPLGMAPIAVPIQAEATPPATTDLSGRLIVVIDDEEAIVAGMRALLESWGAEVIGSLSGNDILPQVEACGRIPDLIIADYRLGGNIVGTEMIERLREELDPEIPALVVTGSTAPERITEADSRRYDLLLKPVQPERLRALIDANLRMPIAAP
jgi:two-component system, sensor histidine kinase